MTSARGRRTAATDDRTPGFGHRRATRSAEPDLSDDIDANDLSAEVRKDLLTLDKTNAETVARHLVAAGTLVDDDPRLALEHARTARQRASRVAAVREAVGITAYHAGEWAEAVSELRAARRIAGGPGLVAVLADCERALGRPDKALEIGRSAEARALDGEQATELRIVLSGARRDLAQYDAAVVTLQTPELGASRTGPLSARLSYAYAEALLAAGRRDEAREWFSSAADADGEETDARDRLGAL